MGSSPAKKLLLIDTDPGIDDAMAILAAFNSPEVEVIGLSSLFGNVRTPMATANAVFLRELADRHDVPVAEGSLAPLSGIKKAQIADFVHGADGFGNTGQLPAKGQPVQLSAAMFICEMVAAHPGRVTLLALASLTNVAMAMKHEPTLAANLAELVILGGAFFVNGNINPAAEANIFGDPEAADFVLGQPVSNVRMVGLDVTHEVILSLDELNRLPGKGRFGTFLHNITKFYYTYHQESYGMQGIYMHDPTALVAVLAPELFTWQTGEVRVVTEGVARGHTIMDLQKKRWHKPTEWAGRPKVQVAVGVNSAEAEPRWCTCIFLQQFDKGQRGDGAGQATAEHAVAPARRYLELEPYAPPEWASRLTLVPRERFCLGLLPTPVHRFAPPGLPEGIEMWIKRDDLTGMQLSGNKVRKLEFLIAEVRRRGHDCVITIGGIQSNHCRATAVAARYLGLDCHLLLRTSKALVDKDPGLVGNLLVERMAGAEVHLVTKEEYTSTGSVALGERLAEQLQSDGRNPCVIPVGGSNALGTWGYLEAAREMDGQLREAGITDVALASGSGGTAGGIALGLHLAGHIDVRVHAYGVCDDPDYFYDYIDGLYADMGATPALVGADARGLFRAVQAKGEGYAISTEAELQFTADVSRATGIVLDPVYSGKALFKLLEEMRGAPDEWRGRRVMFLHTGGLLGMYDKLSQLEPILERTARADRLMVDV